MDSSGPYRILMLHNRYQIRGGEDESTDAEVAMLRERGHTVELVELDNKSIETVADKVRAGLATTWSRKGAAIVEQHLAGGHYDILHCQNLFPGFSPSVYYTAARHKVPVVQAVRNYRLLCASANLFRDGHYCDDCVGKMVPLPALVHRCYRGSLASTAALVAMQSVHKSMGTWSNRITRYIALTRYVRNRLVEGGIPADRIVVKPNFVGSLDVSEEDPGIEGPYAVYVGRLTQDKGADWLARTWVAQNFGMPLVFVGHGDALDTIVPGNEARICPVGKRSLTQTYRIIQGAQMLVQPALWPEPFGRVVVEAYSLGVPVVSARVGGLQELVRDGVTGFTYEAGDDRAFGDAVRAAMDPARHAAMSAAVRREYEEKYSPDANFGFMMDIYRDAIVGVASKS